MDDHTFTTYSIGDVIERMASDLPILRKELAAKPELTEDEANLNIIINSDIPKNLLGGIAAAGGIYLEVDGNPPMETPLQRTEVFLDAAYKKYLEMGLDPAALEIIIEEDTAEPEPYIASAHDADTMDASL